MSYKDLVYAVAIYNEGSFSAAAKMLYISQSALRQAIQKLENAFGFPLFLHYGVHTEPTREGHVFVERAKEIIQLWTRFEDEKSKTGFPSALSKR